MGAGVGALRRWLCGRVWAGLMGRAAMCKHTYKHTGSILLQILHAAVSTPQSARLPAQQPP